MLERATRECRTSPQMATRSPDSRPLRRRMVSASRSAWVGCVVGAVAAVDDGAVDLFREQLDRVRVGMAHHQHVRMHGVQRHGGVDQGLALLDRAGGDRHVDDVGTEPFPRQLEGGAGTGGIFEKEVDTGAPAQGGALFIGLAILFNVGFGKVEELGNLVRRKPLNAEKMSVRKANLRRSSGH